MKMKNVFFIALLLFYCAAQLAAKEKLPKLFGDGINDDTQAIQALLDSRETSVYLPAPAKHYVNSKALRIHSNQTLKLDPATLIRRADGTNDYMITNDDILLGNRNITISGGIWDGNNYQNNCDYLTKNNSNAIHHGELFMGGTLLMLHVEHLNIEKLTVKDPVLFGIHIGGCKKFTIADIIFDYNMKNPSMDGIHLQGGCCEGRITNIKGNTNDDMVAVNSDDVPMFAVTKGAITDIQIDGLWVTNCFRGVRFLTAGAPIRRISISNIFGSYYRNAVAFTHYGLNPGQEPVIEDISINNIFCSKIDDPELAGKLGREGERKLFAIIGCEGRMNIDNLTISNVFRREWMPEAAPTIRIQQGAKIGTLRLRDIQHINMTDKPLPFFLHEASIVRLIIDGVVIREKTGADAAIPITGGGTVLNTHGEFIIEGEQELIDEKKRVDENVKANPPKEQRL
jgi:hypothetical protein